MKSVIYVKDNFTVADFLEQVKECGDECLILDSCYSPFASRTYFDSDALYEFEPTTGFYNEESEVIVVSTFSANYINSKTLGEFREFASGINQDIPMNRDVEDGFVFRNYDNMVFNDKYIVLC